MDAAALRPPAAEPLLLAAGISVHYHATLALDGVDLDLRPGEVHAVVGENGAGKSTLMRSVAGAVPLTHGAIRLRAGARVAWVPQETELPPELRVEEWLFLGNELRGSLGWLRVRDMRQAAAAALAAAGCSAPPQARIRTLPITQRKQVQLARALRLQPDLLLLDEPTAVLGHSETAVLFAVIRRLKRDGAGVLYVSHRLEEVVAIADRVTVLRDGRRVSTDPVSAVDPALLVQRMVGRYVPARAQNTARPGAVVLQTRNVAVAQVHGFTLALHRGEIVGLAGLVGAGRSEVLEAIAGLRPLRSGQIQCATSPVLVPEDRGSKGLIRALDLRQNLCLPAETWIVRPQRERQEAAEWIARLRIRADHSEAPVDSLSGGNQQKLLLARALRRQPRLLLLDEPTAGVDVGVKAEIHGCIRQLTTAGAAVLLSSSDLPELLSLCDRIVALHEGRTMAVLTAAEADEDGLAALITGAAVAVGSRELRVESE